METRVGRTPSSTLKNPSSKHYGSPSFRAAPRRGFGKAIRSCAASYDVGSLTLVYTSALSLYIAASSGARSLSHYTVPLT
jgi:hypothetical protein